MRAFLLLIGLVVVLPLVLPLIGLGAAAQWGSRIGGFALVFLLMTAGLAALYPWGPSRRVAQWSWITPGAILAIVVTMVASSLFTWYVASSFGSYEATYGSLGTIFGLMTPLWITAIIVISGAELNSETEHQTRQDTTAGRPRPLGVRGAVMADTVGSAYGVTPSSAESEPRLEKSAREPLALGRLALLGGLSCFRSRLGR